MLTINKDLENFFLGYDFAFSETLNLETAIRRTINLHINNRFLSANHYYKFIIFLCDIGRLDLVYYALFYVDKNNLLLDQFILEERDLKRIQGFSQDSSILTLQKISLYDSSEKIIKEGLLENFLERFYELKEMKDRGKIVSRKEIMILSFMFFLVVKNYQKPFSCQTLIDIVLFFKSANTEQIRRDHCYFYIIDYVLKHDVKEFFQLSKKGFFNHITYILHSLPTTQLLSEGSKDHFQKIFINCVHNNNSFKTQKRLKFAVCVSGIYRNHEEALYQIKDDIADRLDADVFVHTWDKMQYWSGYGGNPYCERVLGKEFLSTIPHQYHINLRTLGELFPKTTAVLEAPLVTDNDIELLKNILQPQEIIVENEDAFLNSLGDLSGFMRFRSTCNQIKMFYGIKKSFDLALDHDEYDFIIRVRPDASYQDIRAHFDEFEKKLENNTLYAHMKYEIGINDLFFYMSSSVAKEFSNFVGTMLTTKMLSPYDDFPIIDSHALFNAWLFANNYSVRDVGDICQLYINPRITVPNLKEAILQDQQALSAEDFEIFEQFIKLLMQYYC